MGLMGRSGRMGRRKERVRVKFIHFVVTILILNCVGAFSAEPAPVGAESASSRKEEAIIASADLIVPDKKRGEGWWQARGNVRLTRGEQEVRADYALVNKETGFVYARGRVYLRREDGSEWRGDAVKGNFYTGIWEGEGFQGSMDPFRVVGSERIRRLANKNYLVVDSTVTTCTNKHPHCHFRVKTRKAEVKPGEYIKAWGAAWYLGDVPVFYLPYWYRDLNDDTGWSFQPGFNSRMGAYLLSSYKYKLNPNLKEETHVDYRTKRGIAVGQDFSWFENGRYTGKFKSYYAADQQPIDDDEDPDLVDIDEQRYRLFLKHHYDFTPTDYVNIEADYLSDTDVNEDFFEKHYREKRQPENYATYSHRDEAFTFNLGVNGRLNDFYSSVNRYPEASLDIMRRQLGKSAFYYQGQAALANLEKVYPKVDGEAIDDPYSALRIDTSHMLYRPDKHFAFLNLVPRTGFRVTYYSETIEHETTTQVATSLITNTVVSAGTTNLVVGLLTETNDVTTTITKGSDIRALFEIGAEASFKAFKTWDNGDMPMRHIVEPYANYTLVPEVDLTPDNLYQFDEIDDIGKQHWVQLGVRNKIQTKKYGWPVDLVDADIYTIANLDTEEGQDAIENFYFDAELRPSEDVSVDADAIYNVSDGNLDRFNLQAAYADTNAWSGEVEYRYRYEDSSLISGTARMRPNINWTFEVYGRYEMEGSRLEEEGLYIYRNFDCMVWRTGAALLPGYERSDGSERDDEWRFTVEMWLTSFPHLGLTS